MLVHEALTVQSREQRASKQNSLVSLCEQETGQQFLSFKFQSISV